MAHTVTDLHDYLLSKVNNKDDMAVEMVGRYAKLLKMFYEMEQQIDDDGPLIIDELPTKTVTKSHPLISDMKNINAQLINLKKDIDKHINEHAEYLESQKSEYQAEELI